MDIYIGVDIGLRRTGLAISGPGGLYALPIGQFEIGCDEEWGPAFKKAVEPWLDCTIQAVILGLPYNAEGKHTQLTRRMQTFSQWITHELGWSVVEWDERYSTFAAESLFRERGFKRVPKKGLDSQAAALILENYLHSLTARR